MLEDVRLDGIDEVWTPRECVAAVVVLLEGDATAVDDLAGMPTVDAVARFGEWTLREARRLADAGRVVSRFVLDLTLDEVIREAMRLRIERWGTVPVGAYGGTIAQARRRLREELDERERKADRLATARSEQRRSESEEAMDKDLHRWPKRSGEVLTGEGLDRRRKGRGTDRDDPDG
jgi:hypothetical protein